MAGNVSYDPCDDSALCSFKKKRIQKKRKNTEHLLYEFHSEFKFGPELLIM